MNFVSRAYTPITKMGTKGKFDILVKTYPNGLMCKYLESLAEGTLLEI
jgi:NAD(P)H-flavin reductase